MPRNTDLTNLALIGTNDFGTMQIFKFNDSTYGIGEQVLNSLSSMHPDEVRISEKYCPNRIIYYGLHWRTVP